MTIFVKCQDNYNDEYSECAYGPDYYSNDGGDCNHNYFPDEKIEEKYGSKISTCCGFHGYTYIHVDGCNVKCHFSSYYFRK